MRCFPARPGSANPAYGRIVGTPRRRAAHALTLLLFTAHTDSAFYPIIGQMERAAGLGTTTTQARLDKLDVMLGADFDAQT